MYTKILVPVDGSPTSTQGLDEAIKLAKLTGAQLKLFHVVDLLSFASSLEFGMCVTPEMFSLLREGGEAVLADAKVRAKAAGVPAATTLIDGFTGRVCDLVVSEALQWGAELIVIGTHGRRGVTRLLLGSDAEQIVRLAPVPVLLVHARQAAADTADPEQGGGPLASGHND